MRHVSPRLLAAVLAVGLAGLLAAGCVAPADQDTFATPDAPPDPESDTLGWENGYWHNESLTVTPGDGLNDSELDAVTARAMARVEKIRGLEFDRDVPATVEPRAEFRDRFGGGGGGSDARAVVNDATFEALFLVGEDRSGGEAESETTAANVVGVYLPSADRIVLISETETPRVDETVLGHELVHALQTRTFDLGFNTSTREQRNTRNAVVEGDARYVDHRYDERCDEEWECVTADAGDDNGGGPANGSGEQSTVHYGISILNYFPYSDGPVFVRHVYEGGGWDAVADLYTDPPASTEQVIVPQRYGEGEPRSVSVPDRSAERWERVTPGRVPYASVGMPGITAMFAYTAYDDANESAVIGPEEFLEGGDAALDPLNYNVSYAAGWDGDRLRAYRDGDQRGYVWRLAWDSPAEAEEFARGYRALLAHWGGERAGDGIWRVDDGRFADAFRLSVEGDVVTVVNAPSEEDLDGVHASE